MKTKAKTDTTVEIRKVAKEAYIYGFPLVDNYRIQHAYFVDQGNPEYKTSWNRIHHDGAASTTEQGGQIQLADTPASYLGADLRHEPLVISVPDVDDGRYYSVQFVDLYTHNFAYIGSRTTGNRAGKYLLVGPGWNGAKPPGIAQVIRSETEFAFLHFRTQQFNAADLERVRRVQSGYQVQTYSEFMGRTGAAPSATSFLQPLDHFEERTTLQFFNVLNFVLRYCPAHPSEDAMLARFARFGIMAGSRFEVRLFSPEMRQAFRAGIGDAWLAHAQLLKAIAAGTVSVDQLFGTRDHLANNYQLRMTAAAAGIYGNSAEEAFYRTHYLDGSGRPLDTRAARYVLRFAPDGLPPVNAFWSLALYELPAQSVYANPLNRYLINSDMLPELNRDADGGLTIHVQHSSPGAEREANWLPSPRGPIKVALRLYWPKAEVLDGRWKAPVLRRVH